VEATLSELIEGLAADLRPIEEQIGSHPVLAALERGALPVSTLQSST
jgi:hypothetical protein